MQARRQGIELAQGRRHHRPETEPGPQGATPSFRSPHVGDNTAAFAPKTSHVLQETFAGPEPSYTPRHLPALRTFVSTIETNGLANEQMENARARSLAAMIGAFPRSRQT